MNPWVFAALLGAAVVSIGVSVVYEWRSLNKLRHGEATTAYRSTSVWRSTWLTWVILAGLLLLALTQLRVDSASAKQEAKQARQQLRRALVASVVSAKRAGIEQLFAFVPPAGVNDGVELHSYKETVDLLGEHAAVTYTLHGERRADAKHLTMPLLLPSGSELADATAELVSKSSTSVPVEVTRLDQGTFPAALIAVELPSNEEFKLRVQVQVAGVPTGQDARPSVVSVDPRWFPVFGEYSVCLMTKQDVVALASPSVRGHAVLRLDPEEDLLDSGIATVEMRANCEHGGKGTRVSYTEVVGITLLMFSTDVSEQELRFHSN